VRRVEREVKVSRGDGDGLDLSAFNRLWTTINRKESVNFFFESRLRFFLIHQDLGNPCSRLRSNLTLNLDSAFFGAPKVSKIILLCEQNFQVCKVGALIFGFSKIQLCIIFFYPSASPALIRTCFFAAPKNI